MTEYPAAEVKPKREITKLCAQAAKAHIKTWRESGMKLSDYCHQNAIAKSAFYGWVSRYENKTAKGFSPILLKPEVLPEKNNTPTLAMPILNKSHSPEMEMTLPNGVTIQIYNLAHSTQVIQIIKGLM